MKKYGKKIIFLILFLALILVFVPLLRNRYEFGVWNPLSPPDRVQCYNRCYYFTPASPQTLNISKKPKYSLSKTDNQTGKDFYTLEPKGDQVPTVIYLKRADGTYLQYVLSGGP
jgi:hypothetical protein